MANQEQLEKYASATKCSAEQRHDQDMSAWWCPTLDGHMVRLSNIKHQTPEAAAQEAFEFRAAVRDDLDTVA